MSEIVTGILKFAFGFISEKFRTYGAKKLQDGDLTDQKFRGLIVSELGDINSKLKAWFRKDLATSVSSFEKGVERLHMCFGESIESEDSFSSELPKNERQLQDTTNVGASTSTQTKAAQKLAVAVEDAIERANAVGKLKIKSSEYFELAKESFKEAGKKASEAFHNAALSTEERVLASKVRIASGILEHSERPEVAASDCLGYLKELHDMPAIQEIFSVQVKGGIKRLFKKDSRAVVVETVTMINLMLADFISKSAKRRMGVLDWPMIKCGKRVVHPIYYKEESVREMEKMGITALWNIVKQKETDKKFCRSYAINSKEDIIGVYDGGGIRKFDKATGKAQPFCVSASDDKTWGESFIAIDDNDTVYVLSCKISKSIFLGEMNYEPMLSVYSSDGQNILHCPMDFTEGQPRCVTVAKGKKIMICCGNFISCSVYVCDSNGKLIKSFPILLQSAVETAVSMIVSCDKSSDNEIILTTVRCDIDSFRHKIVLYVCTQEGQLERTLKLPRPVSFESFIFCSSIFDHVTKNYLVYIKDKEKTCVKCLSETRELRNLLFLDDMAHIAGSDQDFFLVNNANGVIAMVNDDRVVYLRSSMM